MKVKVLGAAAGGGFPQWNCRCANCQRRRLGTFAGPARTQAQLAVSADGQRWTLLNASPDLRAQIEATPALWPTDGTRNTPISSIILTSAEVDQALGLLLLREFQPLEIYAAPTIRRILTEDNSMFGVLRRFEGQAVWHDIHPGNGFVLPGGLRCEAISANGHFPGFVDERRFEGADANEAVLGLIVSSNEDAQNGLAADTRESRVPPSAGAAGSGLCASSTGGGAGKFAFLPGVPFIPDAWLGWLETCTAIFFDGTFWADDELIRVLGTAKTAREMGHLPVSGPEGTLDRLSALKGPRKIFLHINNTNPMLDEDGPEWKQARDAGWEVARDGLELEL